MDLRWYGHACFLCEGEKVRLLTDPFDQDVGYSLPRAEVDLVTVSHDHHDHNAVQDLPGWPLLIKEPGVHDAKGLKIEGFSVFHDGARGAERGRNLIFVWEMDRVRLCHLGDLGHVLEPATVQAIGRVDLLMIPVGGIYTIDADCARQVVEQLQPRLVVPMHYKTPALTFKLDPVDKFTRFFNKVRRAKTLHVEPQNLPAEPEVAILDY